MKTKNFCCTNHILSKRNAVIKQYTTATKKQNFNPTFPQVSYFHSPALFLKS